MPSDPKSVMFLGTGDHIQNATQAFTDVYLKITRNVIAPL